MTIQLYTASFAAATDGSCSARIYVGTDHKGILTAFEKKPGEPWVKDPRCVLPIEWFEDELAVLAKGLSA